MTKVTGFLYVLSYESGVIMMTVSLDDVNDRNQFRALLIAALYQAGYAPVAAGNSVSFEVTKANAQHGPGVGRAMDTLGRALGGISYVIAFQDYQAQQLGGAGEGHYRSERFRIEAWSQDLKRFQVVEIVLDDEGGGKGMQ